MTIKPKPQFRHLTEAAVTAALFDPDPDNPVAIEVNRLIAAHTKAFIAHVQKLGYMPPSLLEYQTTLADRGRRPPLHRKHSARIPRRLLQLQNMNILTRILLTATLLALVLTPVVLAWRSH